MNFSFRPGRPWWALGLFLVLIGQAGARTPVDTLTDLRNFRPSRPEIFGMFQFWTVWTPEFRIWDAQSASYEVARNLWHAQVRRARLGVRGEILPRLTYTTILAFDQIGHNPRSGTFGGTNNGSFPSVGILDALVTWKAFPQSDGLVLTAGYFRPQYGRESVTSGFAVNSLDKTLDQNYLREHLVYSNPGRAPGINIGGQRRLCPQGIWLHWDGGIFFPDRAEGDHAILAVGRMALTLGDAESPVYTLAHRINTFGQRRGITLGIGGGRDIRQDIGSRTWALGVDLLANAGPVQLDGEWHWLGRETDPSQSTGSYISQTGHLRAGWNLFSGKSGTLEASAAVMAFLGGMSAGDQALAVLSGSPSGRESALDAGLNWWFNSRTVIQLHHTFRQGDPGFAGDGATVNAYFTQSGIGAIRRGGWMGLALRTIL